MGKQGHYMSNLFKAMICECWVNNPDLTFEKIAKIHNCHHTHVSRVIADYRSNKIKVNKTILSEWITD